MLVHVGPHQAPFEQLADDAECEFHLELRAACPQDLVPAASCPSAGLLEQRRLPDAGLTLDHHDPTPVLQQILDCCQFPLALEQPLHDITLPGDLRTRTGRSRFAAG